MNHDEYLKAANYWKTRDSKEEKMDSKILKKHIEDYIKENNTCALATAYGDFIRCTPIEYFYYNSSFYILTEGGEKFHGLEHNKNVSIAIFDKFSGFSNLKGLQIKGYADVIEYKSEEYMVIAKLKNLNLDALEKHNSRLYLIKVIPEKYEFINSDFIKSGFNPRQSLEI